MPKSKVATIEVSRIDKQECTITPDLVAVEEPLEIRIGFGATTNREQKSISVTMRTPGNDFELAIGFLFTEGIITSINQIHTVQYCTEANTLENKENIVRVELEPEVIIDLGKLQRNFYTTSSCGVCGKESIEAVKVHCQAQILDLQSPIKKEFIISLPDKLRAQQSVFEHTGGLHACALFDFDGDLIYLREDVGRHNAMDKLVGAVMGTDHTLFTKSLLLLSGRASFELLQKAAVAGIPIVCAVGAPSSLAAEIAEEFGITLIGFLRGERFNIYTNPHRISI